MSGRDTKLFVNEVDGELICSICKCVLNDPVDTPCAHSFCKACITSQVERCVSCLYVCLCIHVWVCGWVCGCVGGVSVWECVGVCGVCACV